jgi:hypothetical protein
MSVELKSFATGKVVTLKGMELQMFEAELKATKRRSPGKGVRGFRIAPDCAVTVRRGKRKTEYLLYGRAVLHEIKTGQTWQFYFGLQLLEWLHS